MRRMWFVRHGHTIRVSVPHKCTPIGVTLAEVCVTISMSIQPQGPPHEIQKLRNLRRVMSAL
jgi:hypothetical protein